MNDKYFDVIIVGSGVGGATLAKEFSAAKKKVLLLEQGDYVRRGEGLFTAMSVLRNYQIGPNLSAAAGVTVGGGSMFYLAVADSQLLKNFSPLGIDLSSIYPDVQSEINIAVLPDNLISKQSMLISELAKDTGLDWNKREMLVDPAKCQQGYSYQAKWHAGIFLQQAIRQGAELRCLAKVEKVIVVGNKAIGVRYNLIKGKKIVQTHDVYADKIILAGGVASSPRLLQAAGIGNIGDRGFYCTPGFFMTGFNKNMHSSDNFAGCMGTPFVDGISYGDCNLSASMFRMFALSNKKFLRYFSHRKSIGVGVLVEDECDGEFNAQGVFHKSLSNSDLQKLEKGRQQLQKLLQLAGATDIFATSISSAKIGGLIRIHEHVDVDLQTAISNLYVCDGSVIPENSRLFPTLTIICLAKYLTKSLLNES